MFVLLAAIAVWPHSSITELAERTRHNKGNIRADIEKLRLQFGVDIPETGLMTFHIESWGPLLNAEGVKQFLLS